MLKSIAKYTLFHSYNPNIFCQPKKSPFPQLNGNKSLTWNLTVLFQQAGAAKHTTLRGGCVPAPGWVVEEGFCCSTCGNLPAFLEHTSHIYSPHLTYKRSCTIHFHALLSNSLDLNEDNRGIFSQGEYDFKINMLKCKIIFQQTDKCFCLRAQCL